MANPNRPKVPVRTHVTLRLSPGGDAAIADYARRNHISWSEAARRALAAGLTALDRKDQP